jgi:hypothetical protein
MTSRASVRAIAAMLATVGIAIGSTVVQLPFEPASCAMAPTGGHPAGVEARRPLTDTARAIREVGDELRKPVRT